jgi:hypothetical protein
MTTVGLRAVAAWAVVGAALVMAPAPAAAGEFDRANRWMAKRFERFARPAVDYTGQPIRRSNRAKRK